MKINFFKNIIFFDKNFWKGLSRETYIIIFFSVILFLIFTRLFWLQVIKADNYKKILYSQHFKQSLLKAKRGNIFAVDRAGKKMKLTENIELYDMYVDPKFINRKERVIEIISPLIFKHFCELNGIEKPTKEECIRNIEKFSGKLILPEEKKVFYLSGDEVQSYITEEEINEQKQKIINEYKDEEAVGLISMKLDEIIKIGQRERNYVGFFENNNFLKAIKDANLSFIDIIGNYVYIIPKNVTNKKSAAQSLEKIFSENGYFNNSGYYESLMELKDIRYVKLVSGLNSQIAKEFRDLKVEYYSEKLDRIPLLHGVGLEKYERRFYPYGDFMAHLIGFVDKNGKAFYGIEEYFNEMLNGKDGKIMGLSVPWIGTIGSNTVDIQKPKDGMDIYLTIDPTIQQEIEKILAYYYNDLGPDSISIVVMDPYTGKMKAMGNYPTFDLNLYDEVYKIRPLKYEDRYIVDNDTYLDVPILIEKDGKLSVATYNERKDYDSKKYIFKNLLGPQVFIDKNIGFPYEPGSIFKAFTIAIGLDVDEIGLYDLYDDTMAIQVGPYTIKNIHKECKGTNSFLNSLKWSCNVGMVRIALRMQRYTYYSYLDKLGFGKLTGIELSGEKSGEISAVERFSLARFFNNVFGQGILTTPVQVAVGYSAMVNGGYLVKPTIVEKIYNHNTNEYLLNETKVKTRVFKEKTSQDVKDALGKVVSEGDLKPSMYDEKYALGGKTGTSQIVFRGRYQAGSGWTNGSFAGIITKNNLKYVVVIQVRRPRKTQWGLATAGYIYRDVAKFLIEYDGISS